MYQRQQCSHSTPSASAVGCELEPAGHDLRMELRGFMNAIVTSRRESTAPTKGLSNSTS